MRMDSFRAVCLPSALSLHRHPRLAFFFFSKSLLCLNIRPISGQQSLKREKHHHLRPPSPQPPAQWIKPQTAQSHTYAYIFFSSFFKGCTIYRLQAHKHRLQTGIALTWSPLLLSFPDGNADREDMLFSFSFFSLSKNHGVRARMRFTGSTDGITSADMTHRPKSICLFSNRPSHGREETSAYHGSNGYVEGGCPQTSCMFHHALSRKGKNERCSRCRVTQIPSTEEVLKCGDVWTEPSVSVATLHPLPHPHFAIQNKHSSLWMCVISLCHNTDRQSPSLTPQRQCKPQHENAALRCSGGKRPKCSEIGIPGRWDAHHRKVRKKTQGRDFRSVWGTDNMKVMFDVRDKTTQISIIWSIRWSLSAFVYEGKNQGPSLRGL